MTEVSPAFAGCSEAYVTAHLEGRRCLDGRPHDGSPCLINDESRAAEATALLAFVPPAIPGAGLVSDGTGRWVLSSEVRGMRSA